MVIWPYPTYIQNGKHQHIFINKDFVSVETYLKHKRTEQYDAFILGNSRSIYYPIGEWKKWIKGKTPFHMDAAGETLWGINAKLRLLDSLQVPVSDVLIITDPGSMKGIEDIEMPLLVKHPALSGRHWLSYQWIFLKSFLRWNFIFPYLDLKYGRGFQDYMRRWGVFDNYLLGYDSLMNEMTIPEIDEEIASNPHAYYQKMKLNFDSVLHQKGLNYPPLLNEKRKKLWMEIKEITNRKNIQLRIVISPLFEGRPMALADEIWLEATFGAGVVFNFTGENTITKNRFNYYENSHYRPHVATFILNSIYSGKTNNQIKEIIQNEEVLKAQKND